MDIAILADKLTKRYGTFTALDSLDLSVGHGEVFGYLGPNGAGKTTTIRALLGLSRPTSGSLKIFGLDSQTQKIEAHKLLAFVPAEASFWPSLTGAETLQLLGNLHGNFDAGYKDELIARFDFDPNKKVRTYSKGNKQKISIIAALMTRPRLLVMDEPTSGLDPLMEQVFRDCIRAAKAAGQTVFLSSHSLEQVEALCDRVGVLRAGRLVETGTLAQLRHLSAVTVEVTFDGPPPKLPHIKNVRLVSAHEHTLSLHVHGSMDELLTLLAHHHPRMLISRKPSLEELFLSLYGTSDTPHSGERHVGI